MTGDDTVTREDIKSDRREDVVIREVEMKGIKRKILAVPTLWD